MTHLPGHLDYARAVAAVRFVLALAVGSILTATSAHAADTAPRGGNGVVNDHGDPCTPQPDASGTLSNKLSRCKGVLTPPSIGMDPGIHVPAPAPDPNSDLVIKPHNGSVVPK